MCMEELDLHLKLCALKPNDTSSSPSYLKRLVGKHVSDSIQNQILTSHIRNNEYYEGHKVPLTSALLKIIKKRKYISEEPDLTPHNVQKGLTMLGVGLFDEDQIANMNKLYKYVHGATSTSPDDICKLATLTAKLPDTMEHIIEQLKIFANILYPFFTATCPLFMHLKEIIKALISYKPSARVLMNKNREHP